MGSQQTEQDLRIKKFNAYESEVGESFPSKSNRTHTVQNIFDNFDDLADTKVVIDGRVRYWRDHGKLTFAHIEDVTGKIQVALSAQDMDAAEYERRKLYDVGDILEVSGTPFVTHKGEQSLLVSSVRLLSKAIQPLPDKWHGIQDEEMRYRKRYVDMLMNPELREMFVKKSIFWNSIRTFLLQDGFLEVETPVLESTPGGADAEPFATHHNALDIDVYLRISMGELWQKRLMVAGYEKTFEIGRQFRNEGMSPEHLQDYTQMEFYWAYANYDDGMDLTERLYKHCLKETFGTLQFSVRGFDIDLDKKWEHLDFTTAVKDGTGVDIGTASVEEMRDKCKELGISIPDVLSKGRLMDTLWKYCRKSVGGPVFLVNHPVEVSPLAKRKADAPHLVERFQIIIAGSELGNGYSELNNPFDQKQRFETQSELREAGDAEAQMHDQEFVEALEHGMPPTCGFGLSERLFSFMMDKPVRECVMFPLLRPKHVSGSESQSESVNTILSEDITLQEFSANISRADALAFIQKHVKDENLRRHMIATEALMKKLAEHFEAKSAETWGITGLLHDVDWEETEPEQHSMVGADMLEAEGVHAEVVNAVREHNALHGLEPKTIMSKSLQCLEQLTGLIIAATLVRPDKDVRQVKLKSVRKKFKDKSFAKGVNRDNITRCDKLLGLTVDESIQLCLEGMQAMAEDLELDGRMAN